MADCLLVVGNTTLSTDDQTLNDRLETPLGFTMTVDDDSDTERTSGFDLVVISESCASTTVSNKYLQSTMPVLHMEGFAMDEGTTDDWIDADPTTTTSKTSFFYPAGAPALIPWTGQIPGTTVSVCTGTPTTMRRAAAGFGAGFVVSWEFSSGDTSVIAGVYPNGSVLDGGDTALNDYGILFWGTNFWSDVNAAGLQFFDDMVAYLTFAGTTLVEDAGQEVDNNATTGRTMTWPDGAPADGDAMVLWGGGQGAAGTINADDAGFTQLEVVVQGTSADGTLEGKEATSEGTTEGMTPAASDQWGMLGLVASGIDADPANWTTQQDNGSAATTSFPSNITYADEDLIVICIATRLNANGWTTIPTGFAGRLEFSGSNLSLVLFSRIMSGSGTLTAANLDVAWTDSRNFVAVAALIPAPATTTQNIFSGRNTALRHHVIR